MNTHIKLDFLTLMAAGTLALSACGGGDVAPAADLPPVVAPAPTQALVGGAMQGKALTLSTAVSTLAGSASYGTADGTGTAARFAFPIGITTDGTNLYVVGFGSHRIRKIVIATGEVTTVAGSTTGYSDGTGAAAQFANPAGITTDGTNLYVADVNNHRVRKIVIVTGVVTTLAGSIQGYADGTGAAAQFSSPYGITTDGTNLYVSDYSNHRIRKIVIATGAVTSLAGSTSGDADGSGTGAAFNYPWGLTTDGTNLYVADYFNHRIRKIVIATGTVTTLAGSLAGSADGTATAAQFSYPAGITTDGTNLYVGEMGNHRVRKIVISTGVVTTVAGSSAGFADGTGSGAQFNSLYGITTDGTSLFVPDYYNQRIRKIQ